MVPEMASETEVPASGRMYAALALFRRLRNENPGTPARRLALQAVDAVYCTLIDVTSDWRPAGLRRRAKRIWWLACCAARASRESSRSRGNLRLAGFRTACSALPSSPFLRAILRAGSGVRRIRPPAIEVEGALHALKFRVPSLPVRKDYPRSGG